MVNQNTLHLYTILVYRYLVNYVDKLEKFLSQHTPHTRQTYEINLKQFFTWVHCSPEDYLLKDKKEIQEDIKQYWLYIKKKYTPKYTRNSKLNSVRQYLIEYEIELPTVFWKRLRKPSDRGAMAATLDRSPTRYELRKIILEGKPIARALFLMAYSSGMRIGELLKITFDDIDLDYTPTKISIRAEYTKTGDPRTVFISDEATDALKKFLKERDQWIKTAESRLQKLQAHPNYKQKLDTTKLESNRIFPITRQTASQYWNTMLDRSNLDKQDPTTSIRVLHLHCLRKFFRTNMAKPLGLDVTECLLGHRGYLTEAYRRYSIKDLADMYQDSQKVLSIYTEETTDITEVDKEIQELKNINQQKDQQIQELRNQMQMLMAKILSIDDQNSKLK